MITNSLSLSFTLEENLMSDAVVGIIIINKYLSKMLIWFWLKIQKDARSFSGWQKQLFDSLFSNVYSHPMAFGLPSNVYNDNG